VDLSFRERSFDGFASDPVLASTLVRVLPSTNLNRRRQ
jgi:hypothetical protein